MDSEDASRLVLRAKHVRLLAKCLREADAAVAHQFAAECETAAARALLRRREQIGEARLASEPPRTASMPDTAQERASLETSSAA